MVVSHHVGAGNPTQVFCKRSKHFLTTEPSFQPRWESTPSSILQFLSFFHKRGPAVELTSQGGAGDSVSGDVSVRALRHTAAPLHCVPGIPTDGSSVNFIFTLCRVGKAYALQLSYTLSPITASLTVPNQTEK